MPLLTYAPTPLVAALLMVASFAGFALVVTPSLAFIAEAAAAARVESHGVVYGVYNVAWAIGLLVGPAIGGWLYERIGLRATTFLWSPALVLVTLALARVRVAAPSAVVPREPSA
jgi:MFS family permease